MRATRHNGRSGKHGVYNPRHNDRQFDIANSEHIDAEKEKQNIYWDCYRGYVQNPSNQTLRDLGAVEPDASFHDMEKMYYEDHYYDFIQGQNARNEKNRHPERNRTTEDLLKNKMTCPEETIFQIGKEGEHISGDQLFQIADTFMKRFEGRFGEHVHILDFALHMDETTPHIHERHVFDCKNKYGELCPQQEKALEALGIPLPDPDKPRGRNNNRKMMFDLICRNLLLDICREQGLEIEEEPEYGGKKYLEKQEFIIQAQKEKIARQEQKIKDQEERIMDNETLIDEVSEIAYDKAVEVVTEKVRVQTQEEDIRVLDQLCNSIVQNPHNSDKAKTITKNVIKMAKDKLRDAAKTVIAKVQRNLQEPETRKANTEQIKKTARSSILEKLAVNKKRIAEDAARKKNKEKDHDRNSL
ncbi:serine/arginine repetitive matrix protein 2 [Sellimonas caecigallum]|uniref:Serine/arginine repetitive matrix protein 2 n=1 Tax=Sellimonas caecigallum TaxID=2592333 RepID=A0ABS7L7J8_9FIRM|nr:serine/arginine repetitive matrix protein 2 [Sellimonas caecigallum]MBY0758928.1 serine/arginine repetitive matrix protein 2 [Sellimonas caecigallum]